VSRFTIDSATEFLFGIDVCTLSAGLPYPASSTLANLDAFVNHPSNNFTSAVETGQYLSGRRLGYGSIWPLAEFWKNKVKPHRKIVDQFLEPILVEALARRAAVGKGTFTNREKADTEEETLLSHLSNHTQGFFRLFILSMSLECLLFPSDTQVLKDEVTHNYPSIVSC
jgi:hypothetical protein